MKRKLRERLLCKNFCYENVILSTWVRLEERYLSTYCIPQKHVMVEVVENSNCQMFSNWKVYFALFSQLRIVVGRDCAAEELAYGVVGAVDLVVLGGEGVEEEGGKGGGGDVLGGEAEDVFYFVARIELGVLSILKRRVALGTSCSKGKGVPMDHSKSKKHEGLAVCLANASNLSKKTRIAVFEHFTHQLVIVLIDPLVTVCIRS